jgi:hypothetical protein
MKILSNKLVAEFDGARDMYVIRHPGDDEFALVEIRRETLEAMSYKEAAQFIGERFILLMPALKEIFKDYLWSEGGHEPPKRT